jgi:hypothetical protein
MAATPPPARPVISAGTMMNRLDAGVTDDKVMKMFSRTLSDRESS